MKKIELLSPAGNMDSLKAAVEAGADAVYLGGTFFGARAFANNFSDEELIEAINYCHLYGVKVYVTCNILILEREVSKFISYVEFLHRNSVDAIIIQDLAMLALLHKTFPNLELHASTQMHIHNLDGVKIAQKLGCRRVVLARETPIEKVGEIIENTSCEIEIFAHGSLCVSYSGECLFSSLIGHRSGNRGSCVGSCRLPYQIIDENHKRLNKGDYPLSMKDLNTLEYIGKLIDSGVTSLKIEGRMKSPEYVYVVTKLYRMAIDSYYKTGKVFIDSNELNNLKRIFNREFTKGYLFHENIRNIINDNRPNHQGIPIGVVNRYSNNFVDIKLLDKVSIHDGIRIILDSEDYGLELNEFYINKKLVKVANKGDIISFKVNKKIPVNSKVLLTKDSLLVKKIDDRITKKLRKINITGKIIIKENQEIKLTISDGVNEVTICGDIPQKSINKVITKEDIFDKLNKIGDTIYKFSHIDIVLDDNLFVSYKEINRIRHIGIEELNKKRLYQIPFIKNDYQIDISNFPYEKSKSVLVPFYKSNLNYDYIYSENKHDKSIIKLPKVMDNYNNLDINKEYLVGEIGAFNKLKNIYCDYSFNVTNSYSVAILHHLGAKRITLSCELNKENIQDIIDAYHQRYHKHLEKVIKGNLEVMTLKTNLVKIYHDNISLLDRFGNIYPIREIDDKCYIYDYHVLNDTLNYYDIGVNSLREDKVLQ